MKFTVLRQHLGDTMYMPGDIREAAPSEVRHLVKQGVLSEGGARKAEPKLANKAEPVVANKSDPLDHDRNGRKGGVKKAN